MTDPTSPDRIWKVAMGPWTVSLDWNEYDELKKLVQVDDVAAMDLFRKYLKREGVTLDDAS